jgi:glycosyltransferase involved in cell wall biosynthesis
MAVPDVAHIIPYLAARYGGPPAVALGLGRAHRRLGGRVSWWATANESERRELGCLEPEVRLFPRTFPQRWYRASGLAAQLRAEGADFDLFHLHQFWDYPVYAGVRVAGRLGKPIVITPHGVFSHRWGLKALKKQAYLATIGRYIWRRCSCLHATAAPEVEAFRRAGYGGPVVVVPPGVEARQFDRLAQAGKADVLWPRLRGRRVVCFVGRLHRVKGLEHLVAAWRQVVRGRRGAGARIGLAGTRQDAILVVAGPTDNRESKGIRELAEATVPSESILFTGMVTEEAKAALLARADLLVLPSERESFGLVVLEALACGTPVVATTGTPWSVLSEVGAGYWVEPQAEALAVAMCRILDLPEAERRAMGERGRRLVLDRYTWDIAARKMLTVYRCILEGREVPLYPEPARDAAGGGGDLAGAEGHGDGGER